MQEKACRARTRAYAVLRARMIHALVSEHVDATAVDVRALYGNPENWRMLFPGTIEGARVLRRDDEKTVVEVDHVEGRVTNILRDVSPTRIELRESKRRYDATFLNDFVPEGRGMRYTLTASVSLRWPYRLLEPFMRRLIRARLRRYVVEPLKRAAEATL